MFGSAFLSIALASAIVAMVCYAISIRRESERLLTIGRIGFHIAVVSFMCAAASLMYLIFTHQFEYSYVFSYSSRNLSTPLLFASFYAGQQGSFMLWTLMVSLIGIGVLGYSQKVHYEAPVMTVYMLVMTMLLVILVVKSPFATIWSEGARQIPADGRGMNPTLENLWITIHPPILFTGFAAMTVPFVFAVAGLIKRDYQRWISISLPWALFASMVLGFGVMLGGWWAYETLGWGGFWGWDPVENSSLIPWLVCVALVHTMLVQKRTGSDGVRQGTEQRVGGLVKTNFALAIGAFVLVLYSTFLTRSGVLGDTSVHSFVEPGMFIYAVLLGIIILFSAIGVGMLASRWKDLQQRSMEMRLMSRENALGLGSAVLMASAMVVLIGTSWPIIVPLFGQPKVAVPTDFYNNTQLPIAFAIVLLNGIAMMLKWKSTEPREFFRGITVAAVVAALGTVGLILLGVTEPVYALLGFGSLLALVVNLQVGSRVIRGNRRMVGAYVSHAGISLVMLGIIFTSRYSQTQHVVLPQGEPQNVFGYKVTYVGWEQIDLEKKDREVLRHTITLEKGGNKFEVGPTTMLSDFNNRQGAFMHPGILYTPTKDIYVAPQSLDQVGGNPKLHLMKHTSAVLPFDSTVSVTLMAIDMSGAARDGRQRAILQVATPDTTVMINADRFLDGRVLAASIPTTDMEVKFSDIDVVQPISAGKSKAVLEFSSPRVTPTPVKTAISVDISVKPFISLVWVGVLIMVGGFAFAIVRRRKDSRIHERRPPRGGAGTGEPTGPRSTPRVVSENVRESVVARTATQ